NNGAPVTQDVTVTITGVNDGPTIVSGSTTPTGGVTEDAATPTLSTGGTITFQDLDLIDTHTATFALKSTDATANLPGYPESGTLAPIGSFALTPATVNGASHVVAESSDTVN